ncbi:hypothetical protein [Acaricomes phytoseiuli]|uniref:hypothetical protein n=1 Tax=Acaricomes phytoseiuli TaxID=291968 RepID=UPI0004772AC5|nr:hypothetical protein [Acaricomes phytoseiuli]
MNEAKFETKTIDYYPGKNRGYRSRKTLEDLIAEGWEVMAEKNRLSAVSTVTLRRLKSEAPAKTKKPTPQEGWAEIKELWRNRKS